MTTLRYKMFGIGKLPDDLRAAAEAEGVLHVYEGVPVAYEFSGNLPGLVVAGTNTRSYSGALALTSFSAEELKDLPATALSFSVPHEWVLKLAGVPT